jgi:hypothetical protein
MSACKHVPPTAWRSIYHDPPHLSVPLMVDRTSHSSLRRSSSVIWLACGKMNSLHSSLTSWLFELPTPSRMSPLRHKRLPSFGADSTSRAYRCVFASSFALLRLWPRSTDGPGLSRSGRAYQSKQFVNTRMTEEENADWAGVINHQFN